MTTATRTTGPIPLPAGTAGPDRTDGGALS